ncbi:MAG: hypothetical protein IJX18_01385, partial [Clostridia bacterium]|nr:hypothetical protein [Clostridia bacterium]
EEAALHNAQIKERYQRLQSVEASQLAEALSQTPRASVLAPERPVQAQSPVQHVEEREVSSVFTAETLDRTLQNRAPVLEKPIVPSVAQAPVEVQAVAVQKVELSRFAKVFLSACAAVVTVLLCLICVLTQVISAKQVELSALEGSTAQLREEYARILSEKEEIMTDVEAIEEYAKSQGMIKR